MFYTLNGIFQKTCTIVHWTTSLDKVEFSLYSNKNSKNIYYTKKKHILSHQAIKKCNLNMNYTLFQKKRDSFTCSFLALTCRFNLNLNSILRKFSLFPTKPYFCFYRATHNKQMGSKFLNSWSKKSHKNNIISRRLKTHSKNKLLIEFIKKTKHWIPG